MKRILFPLLLIAASAVLLGIGAVACGDDDDDGNDGGTATSAGGGTETLGAYLKDVNDIQEGVTQATDALGDDPDVFADPARARQALSAAIDVAESAVTALKALAPPDEAVSEHEAMIAAGENLAKVARSVSDEMQGMQAGAAFDAFAADVQAPGSDLSNALDDMVSACDSMEAVSVENKTGVDLACPAPRS